MSTQYAMWLLGGIQVWRFRRRTRRTLYARDPEAYDRLRHPQSTAA